MVEKKNMSVFSVTSYRFHSPCVFHAMFGEMNTSQNKEGSIYLKLKTLRDLAHLHELITSILSSTCGLMVRTEKEDIILR